MRNRLLFNRLATTLAMVAGIAVTAQALPNHLKTAEALALKLRAQGEVNLFNLPDGTPLNQYGGSWPNVGVTMAPPARALARCSSFFTLNMIAAYPGWSAKGAGFASASPTAAVYHDAIVSNVCGFQKVGKFVNVRKGDILAVKYTDADDDTGHIMIVRNFEASAPDASGIVAWRVEVIDCSKSAHSFDSRVLTNGGTTLVTNGVGIGQLRVYTQNDKIVGHSWSLSNGSTIYSQTVRHLVLGRYNPQ